MAWQHQFWHSLFSTLGLVIWKMSKDVKSTCTLYILMLGTLFRLQCDGQTFANRIYMPRCWTEKKTLEVLTVMKHFIGNSQETWRDLAWSSFSLASISIIKSCTLFVVSWCHLYAVNKMFGSLLEACCFAVLWPVCWVVSLRSSCRVKHFDATEDFACLRWQRKQQRDKSVSSWGSFVDSKISRRALWEVYYPPFQGALDAGIWGNDSWDGVWGIGSEVQIWGLHGGLVRRMVEYGREL